MPFGNYRSRLRSANSRRESSSSDDNSSFASVSESIFAEVPFSPAPSSVGSVDSVGFDVRNIKMSQTPKSLYNLRPREAIKRPQIFGTEVDPPQPPKKAKKKNHLKIFEPKMKMSSALHELHTAFFGSRLLKKPSARPSSGRSFRPQKQPIVNGHSSRNFRAGEAAKRKYVTTSYSGMNQFYIVNYLVAIR